jgi:hypothetical protein
MPNTRMQLTVYQVSFAEVVSYSGVIRWTCPQLMRQSLGGKL